MNFILNIFEKMLFGVLLLLLFQVPILADHYLQFVSGYYEATSKQVEGYKQNAAQHQYADVYAMIDDLSKNTNSVVRTDAEQKIQTMREYEELILTIATLRNGNIAERAWFMFNPARWATLEKVAANFKPGIPLGLNDIVISVFVALLLSAILLWPLRLIFRKKRPDGNWHGKSRSSF
jgi:hypothetical protein